MEKIFKLEDNYIRIPVTIGAREQYLEICDGARRVFDFKVPGGDTYDYIALIKAEELKGSLLTLRGDFSEAFFENITSSQEQVSNDEKRPAIHFTPEYGWINDPNGLVYDGENYQLYFQHNPFNIAWGNMSWGHAVTKDLLHFEQHDDVLFPDENGTIFSGCGLIHDGRMLFPYTVAGSSSRWSEGKPFYQGLAESYDGGRTLVKHEKPFLPELGKDTRDPKVFWHEKTSAFIMVIYVEKNDFAIFRSEDLSDWQMTQRFTVEEAWECPDLLEIPFENGLTKWMFWSADGFYYWCDFDGYKITSDFKKHRAYLNKCLYATQTYSGVKDRIIAVPWLRFDERNGKNYQGAMGVPKEYYGKIIDGEMILCQRHVGELYEAARPAYAVYDDGAYLIELPKNDHKVEMNVNGSKVTIDNINKTITVDDATDIIPVEYEKIELLVDCNILEISFSNAIIAAYKLKGKANCFEIKNKDLLVPPAIFIVA